MDKNRLDQLRIERGAEQAEPAARRWLWPAVGAAVLAAALAAYLLKPESPVEVRTAVARSVSSGAAAVVLNASGYVNARRQATVSSKFTGRVIEVLIEEGMEVTEGQVLARLDDANIRTSLELARAQFHSAETALDETRALLNEAEANLARSASLAERKLVSEAELDRARALAESLAAQLQRKKADVTVAARQVDVYLQQVEDTIIRAPFAGVIVAKNAQPGEMISPVSAGGGFTRTGIGTIVDMDSLEIEIDVNEAYINRVAAGQEVVATLDAYPDWEIPCHVIAIIPTADRQRATVEVRVGFDISDSRILPDMGVKVAFREEQDPGSAAQPAVLVPAAAVRSDDGQDFVLVVVAGVVERRAVSVGGSRGGDMLVRAGLAGGEKVVVSGPESLVAGTRVEEM